MRAFLPNVKIDFKFNFLNFMTWYAFSGAFLFLAWIVWLGQNGRLAESTSQVMISMVGLLGTIAGFIWGSSSASKSKNTQIEELQKQVISQQQPSTIQTNNVEQVTIAADPDPNGAGEVKKEPIGFPNSNEPKL